MTGRAKHLELDILAQPDDTTCGPTCLEGVYRYWNRPMPLAQIVSEVRSLPDGGTLAVSLGCHALRRGFACEIYTYNLHVFDPTWFSPDVDLAARLETQRKAKRDRKLALATGNYLEFLELGGSIRFEELQPKLLRKFLRRDIPVLAGLSATYLYGCAREYRDQPDDIRGQPAGHFVVLSGYDRDSREIVVADPLQDNPRFASREYRVGMNRLISSILLGIATYDANLLVIVPKTGT